MDERHATAPASSVAAMLAALRRDLLFMAWLCSAIALLLTLLDGKPLAKFVYPFAIGLCCWTVVDLSRLLVAAGLDRLRRLRGQPSAPVQALGWPTMLPILLLAMLVGPMLGLAIGDAVFGVRSPSVFQFGSTGTQVTLAGATAGEGGAVATLELPARG